MNRVRVRRWFPVLVALAAVVSAARADRVIMKNGREIECVVIEETDAKVEIEAQGTRLSLPRSQVKAVERADPADNALRQGDALFAAGQHEEAIALYRQALATRPEQARAKIAAVEAAINQAMDREIEGMAPDAAETYLRARAIDSSLSAAQLAHARSQLARFLMKQADEAAKRVDYRQSRKCLEEAWRLAPDTPGLALALVREIQRDGARTGEVVDILRPYVAGNPNDLEAAGLLIGHIWESEPWMALKLVYPGNTIRPDATPEMKQRLPKVLLACFRSMPYPIEAPFDQVSCYERYLELEPNADRAPLFLARAKKEPNNLQHVYDLAEYHEQQNNLDKAKTTFEQVRDRDPMFRDAGKRAEGLRVRIIEQNITREEIDVAEKETVFREAARLSAADFPLTAGGGQWAQTANLATAALARRPMRRPGAPPEEYLQALQAYRGDLFSQRGPVAKVVGDSKAQKAKVLAAQRKKEREERERQEAETVRYVISRIEAWLASQGHGPGSVADIKGLTIGDSQGTIQAERVRAIGGRVVSATITSPIHYNYRAK